MRPEVIDLDGGDAAPSHRMSMLIVSVVLVGAAVLGYAAVSSPALRGPYATPHPSAGVGTTILDSPRHTPVPTEAIDNAAKVFTIRCVVPGEVFSTTVMVNGQPVRFAVPLTRSNSLACATPAPLPLDRIAR